MQDAIGSRLAAVEEHMSPFARWAASLVGGVALAAILVIGMLDWDSNHPLTAGLEGEWSAVSKEFDGRVKNAFPLRSSDKQMAAELQRQGFRSQRWESSTEFEHEAMRREDSIVCRASARVFWRADAEGQITAIRGEIVEEACL
ncbi:MAG: hypothetical protein ACLPSF_11695 [Methylocella sp.]